MTGVPQSNEWWKGVPVPEGSKPKEMGWGEYLDNIGRKVAAGVSLGWADEVAAGADAVTQPLFGRGSDAPTVSQRYDANLAAEQRRDKGFEKEYPAAATAAEIGGNIAGAVATPMGRVFEAATVPGRMAKSAGAGGAIGAVAGAGGADPGQRTEGAIKGATLGTGVGAGIPVVAAFAERVGPRILDAVGLRNADKGAVSQLLRAMERDGVSPEEAIKRYEAWQASGKKPEALVDLFGENVRNLAAVAANTPGEARTAARNLVTGRKAAASERVGDDVSGAISPNTNYAGTFDDLVTTRSEDAAPLYEKAFSFQGGADNEHLNRLIQNPKVQEGLKRGYAMLRNEADARNIPLDTKMLGVTLNEMGEPTFTQIPNMRVLDAGKRGIDDILEAYRDKTTGRLHLTPEGKSIDEVRRSYLKVLDDLNPDYKAARQAYAGRTDSMEAMALGRDILRADSDVTAKQIADLAAGDKEFFRAGVAKAIQDKIENTADGRDVVASFFNKPALRKKLEAAFDTPEQFRSFEALMKREMEMASTNNVINPRGGSQTMRLQEGAADAGVDPATAFGQLLQGNLKGAAITGTTNMLRGNQRMNSSTADALAPLLFDTEPSAVMSTLNRLSVSGPQYPAVTDARQALARALLGPVPSAQAGDIAAPRRPLMIDVRPSDARR